LKKKKKNEEVIEKRIERRNAEEIFASKSKLTFESRCCFILDDRNATSSLKRVSVHERTLKDIKF